ncbi:MAG: hypothetical protein AB7N80_11250 [Bdellovibrionales bacterium]
MRQKLRPILLITLVSFLLGLWLSLRHAEQDLLKRLREAPTLTILTDQPTWWRRIAELAEAQGVARLALLTPPRREWQETLNKTKASCDLVTTKSYFLRHFHNHKWLDPLPKGVAWSELLHPDFRDSTPGLDTPTYLPLLWSVTAWQTISNANEDGRLELKTSLDDALLIAIDLNESRDDFNEEEPLDNHETAEQLWNQTKENISLALNQPDTHIPLKPIKATQRFVTEAREEKNPTPLNDRLSHNDLWTWGLGVCRGHAQSAALQDFVSWLLENDNVSLMAADSLMALTVMSGEHARENLWHPSNLRGFNLERLRRRELSWDLAAAWEELFSQKPESQAHR